MFILPEKRYTHTHEQYRMTSQVALVVKNLLANVRNVKRHGFNPWVKKIPWRRA